MKCINCGAKCCRYLALEIDKPNCKREFDHIRWYLKHKYVHVFIDHDASWYLEFETPCEELGSDHLCKNYDHRPKICQDHGAEDWSEECEFHPEGEAYVERFSNAESFEEYLDKKNIDWRFKY
ncbi:YkgJ family cysteine cluster protein [Verrucomicrobiota bacterium]